MINRAGVRFKFFPRQNIGSLLPEDRLQTVMHDYSNIFRFKINLTNFLQLTKIIRVSM